MKTGSKVTLQDGRAGVVVFVGVTHTNVTVDGQDVCVANTDLQPKETPATPAPVPPKAATTPAKKTPQKVAAKKG